MTTHIYTLSDPETGLKRYVGKTVRKLTDRLCAHLTERDNSHKRNWIAKLKRNGLIPIIEVIEVVLGEDWTDHERNQIRFHRWLGCDLLNLTDGGEGMPGYVPSEETRKKMSDARKGKPSPCGMLGKHLSPEAKKKMSEARKGKHHSADTCRKIGDAHRGKSLSPNHCQKLSDAHRGKYLSAKTKKKMSDATRGRRLSMEWRKKISDARMGWQFSAETRKKISDTLRRKPL